MTMKQHIAGTLIALVAFVGALAPFQNKAHAITLSELVELFIALEIIPPENADEARAVLENQGGSSSGGGPTNPAPEVRDDPYVHRTIYDAHLDGNIPGNGAIVYINPFVAESNDNDDFIVYLEVRDDSNHLVHYDVDTVGTYNATRDNEKQFGFSWKPETTGFYRYDIGIFSPDWNTTYEWVEGAIPFRYIDADNPTDDRISSEDGGDVPPPPPPAPSSSFTVYSDQLDADGWSVESWAGVATAGNVAVVYEGTRAIHAFFERSWGGYRFNVNGAFDTTPYDDFVFAIQGDTELEYNLYLVAYDTDGNAYVHLITDVVDTPLVDNAWNYVSIPLATLGIDDREIASIGFENGHEPGNLYLDDIRFQ